MTADQLRAVQDAVPFRPYVVHVSSGRSFPIPCRDYLQIMPRDRVVVVRRVDVKAVEIIEVAAITSLSLEDTSPKTEDAES